MQRRLQACYSELCNLYGENNVFFVFLYGSQNYELHSEDSDVDTKAVIFLQQNDLILRKELWTPQFIDRGLCYLTDLYTFLDELVNYVPRAIEVFISKQIYVNPMYKDLFQELMSYQNYLLHRNPHKCIQQFFDLAWEHYRIYSENPTAKELTHAYRTMLCAHDIYSQQDIMSSLQCSIPNKEQFIEWKRMLTVPKELIGMFTELSGVMSQAMESIPHIQHEEIPQLIQEFCVKAYMTQQKISLDFSKKI